MAIMAASDGGSAALRRMRRNQTQQRSGVGGSTDPRSLPGTLSRGDNVYNGGSNSSTGGIGSMLVGGGGTNQTGTSSTSTDPDPFMNRDRGSNDSENMLGDWGSWNPQTGTVEGLEPANPLDDFDAIYEKRLGDLTNQMAQLRSRRESALRSLDQQRAFSQDALKRMFDRNLDRNEINMADRGLYRSGINVREQGRIGDDYQEQGNQMAQQYATNRSGLMNQYAGAEAGLMDLMSQLEHDRALRAEMEEQQAAQRDAEIQAMQPVLSPTGQYQFPSTTQGGGGSFRSDRSFLGAQQNNTGDAAGRDAIVRRLQSLVSQ